MNYSVNIFAEFFKVVQAQERILCC